MVGWCEFWTIYGNINGWLKMGGFHLWQDILAKLAGLYFLERQDFKGSWGRCQQSWEKRAREKGCPPSLLQRRGRRTMRCPPSLLLSLPPPLLNSSTSASTCPHKTSSPNLTPFRPASKPPLAGMTSLAQQRGTSSPPQRSHLLQLPYLLSTFIQQLTLPYSSPSGSTGAVRRARRARTPRPMSAASLQGMMV